MFLTGFSRKVLDMIDAHKTLIGRCAPLAKKVLEMVAIENFDKDPLPNIQFPVQLLLETLYERILDLSEASFSKSVRTMGGRPCALQGVGGEGLLKRGLKCVLGSCSRAEGLNCRNLGLELDPGTMEIL